MREGPRTYWLGSDNIIRSGGYRESDPRPGSIVISETSDERIMWGADADLQGFFSATRSRKRTGIRIGPRRGPAGLLPAMRDHGSAMPPGPPYN